MIGEELRRTLPVSEFEIVMARETAYFYFFISLLWLCALETCLTFSFINCFDYRYLIINTRCQNKINRKSRKENVKTTHDSILAVAFRVPSNHINKLAIETKVTTMRPNLVLLQGMLTIAGDTQVYDRKILFAAICTFLFSCGLWLKSINNINSQSCCNTM